MAEKGVVKPKVPDAGMVTIRGLTPDFVDLARKVVGEYEISLEEYLTLCMVQVTDRRDDLRFDTIQQVLEYRPYQVVEERHLVSLDDDRPEDARPLVGMRTKLERRTVSIRKGAR